MAAVESNFQWVSSFCPSLDISLDMKHFTLHVVILTIQYISTNVALFLEFYSFNKFRYFYRSLLLNLSFKISMISMLGYFKSEVTNKERQIIL